MAKVLMNVTARDPDLGEGGKIKFRLLSSKRVSLLELLHERNFNRDHSTFFTFVNIATFFS